MRLKMMMATVVAGLALAGAAQAQDAATDGEYRASLGRMITSTADGECPADLMAADLLAACNDQVDQIGPALQSLGPVKDMSFVSAEGEGESRVETYDVFFESGQMLTWGIGGYVDGKFTIAFVSG
ncbi:hypothetical protein [Brevundimonas sp. A19_0]|uniref:hypothetical protein n=1 Tax=Brevundimonas sp. A19_0 TaxID=2821087 RepID=UPI001ADA880E|nr:hypothetical protein [Brevundimonas sp. A19_0]MBO9501418.1 hypothetical protein [Brevundimonas sp. A19_0]